jgi:hypothetical protein
VVAGNDGNSHTKNVGDIPKKGDVPKEKEKIVKHRGEGDAPREKLNGLATWSVRRGDKGS